MFVDSPVSRWRVMWSLRNGVDIIHHTGFIDDEGMDRPETRRDEVFVA